MDFTIEEKELDINLSKLDNYMNFIVSNYMCECSSMINDSCNYVIESSFDNFKEKITEIIKKAIEMVKEFANKIKTKIDIKIQQMQINKKLTELKNLLATKRAKALGKKFSMVDSVRYKKYYKEFINAYINEVKKGLNKDFKTVEEFEKWRTHMSNKLSEFKYTLTDSERWRLSLAINDAVKLTEKEVKNRDTSVVKIKNDAMNVLETINNDFVNDAFGNSVLDLNDRKYVIFKKKHGFISFLITQIASCFKTIISFITKHTLVCVTGLLVLLIAL